VGTVTLTSYLADLTAEPFVDCVLRKFQLLAELSVVMPVFIVGSSRPTQAINGSMSGSRTWGLVGCVSMT